MIGESLALSTISAKERYARLTFPGPLYYKSYKWQGNNSGWKRCLWVPMPRIISGEFTSASVESPRGESNRVSKARPTILYCTRITPSRNVTNDGTLLRYYSYPSSSVAAHNVTTARITICSGVTMHLTMSTLRGLLNTRRDSMDGNSTRVWNIDSV